MKARPATILALTAIACAAGCAQTTPSKIPDDAGAGAAPAAAAQPVAGALAQWAGQTGGSRTFETRELNSRGEWEDFWKQVGIDPPRPFDPLTDKAVAVFLGERNTGGYSVRIVSAEARPSTFVVTYEIAAPAADAIVVQMLTSPWAIAVIPRTALPIVFVKPPRG